MPRCSSFQFSRALTLNPDGRYDSYCCGNRLVTIEGKKGPFPFRLNLGGVYDSHVLNTDGRDVEVSTNKASMSLLVEWSRATFIGWHWLLGAVRVVLSTNQLSTGSLRPASAGQTFTLPAINDNEFYFQFQLPRFGRTYTNRQPVINSAQIASVPPIGSLYTLREPVRFENVENGKDWVDITKCWVLMPDQRYIDIDIVDIKRFGDRFEIEAQLTNTSPAFFVTAYWFTHTDEPDNVTYEPEMDTLYLTRSPRRVRFAMKFRQPPADPVVQLGAALITNPIANDPDHSTGTRVVAFNINRRSDFLQSGQPRQA